MSEALPPCTLFHATRRVIFGAGKLMAIADLVDEFGCKRPAVVLDAYFEAGGMQQRLDSLFEIATGGGAAFHLVPNHEPDTRSVEACRAFLEGAAPDMIIAIGGGTAMDTAKVARMLLSNPGDIKSIAGPVGVRMKPHSSLCVCIPTTAGTGSEVSESAVVGVPGESQRKMLFRAAEMAADVAILDPELTTSAPAKVTASAGFDAITHAVEAFTSNMSGPLTDPLAGSAMQLLAGSVAHAVKEPADLTARSMCLMGSMQAAMAFNSANLGLAHAISGALGALYHVPHGVANALALPWTMAFNQAELGQKGNAISAIFGGDTAAHGLSKVRFDIGLDLSLDSFVVGSDKLDKVAEAAMLSGQIKMNPREPTLSDMRAILEHMREPTGGEPPLLIVK